MNKTFSTEDVIFKICIITALAVVMIARDLLFPLAALLLGSRRRPQDDAPIEPVDVTTPVKVDFGLQWSRSRFAKMETLRQQAESLGIDTDDFPLYEDLLEAVLEAMEALVSADDDYSAEVLTAEQRSPNLLP